MTRAADPREFRVERYLRRLRRHDAALALAGPNPTPAELRAVAEEESEEIPGWILH